MNFDTYFVFFNQFKMYYCKNDTYCLHFILFTIQVLHNEVDVKYVLIRFYTAIYI